MFARTQSSLQHCLLDSKQVPNPVELRPWLGVPVQLSRLRKRRRVDFAKAILTSNRLKNEAKGKRAGYIVLRSGVIALTDWPVDRSVRLEPSN
jgi:hypothetical protein